jgi:hypothetical protein
MLAAKPASSIDRVLMLIALGLVPAWCPIHAQAVVEPSKPSVAIRGVEWSGSSRPSVIFNDINDQIDSLRANLLAVDRSSGPDVQYELGKMQLAQFQARFVLHYVVTVSGHSGPDTPVNAPDGPDAADILLSKVVDKTLFHPTQGVYKGLRVLSIGLAPQRLLVRVQAPQLWAGYETTSIASFALAVSNPEISDTDCQPIKGLVLDSVVKEPSAENGRVATLRFKLNSSFDLETARKLEGRSDLNFALVTHYRSRTEDLSNQPYVRPTGEGQQCWSP